MSGPTPLEQFAFRIDAHDKFLQSHEEAIKQIDVRLERIAEKHEALAESLELLRLEHEKTEKLIRRFGRFVRAILTDHEGRLLSLEGDEDEKET
jgi:hypothetical protein